MIRHVQSIRARGHQRDRGLTVQKAAGRRRYVLVDGVVHELVPEHDPVVRLVEKLSVERVAELPDHLGRRAAGDGGDVAERHGVAEHRRDLQQLQRCRSAGAAGGEPPGRSARPAAPSVVASTLSPVRRNIPSSSSERSMATAHNGFPPALASMAVRAGPGDAPSTATGEHGHVVGRQRLEAQGARAPSRQIIEQPDHLGRQRRRPGGHHDEQRRQRQLPRHRRDRQQACAVRPVDVLGHQQHRALGRTTSPPGPRSPRRPGTGCRRRPRRRPGALAGQQRADRSPAWVR